MDKKNIEAILPLSPSQQGMLFFILLAQSQGRRNDAFFEQSEFHLHGELDRALFQNAWNQVYSRHSALRTCFVWEKREKPLQIVLREANPEFHFEDWRQKSDPKAALDSFRQKDLERGLDLGKAPIGRLTLIQLSDDHHYLAWIFSHLLLDGWSMHRVLAEVFTIYYDGIEGKTPVLPAVRPFRDFILWLQNQDIAAAEHYWREVLADFDGALRMGIDHGNRASHQEQQVRLDQIGTVERWLGTDVLAPMQSYAKNQSLTINSLVQAAFSIFLGLQAASRDVVYGSMVSGRPPEISGVDNMVGMFVNALPVRAHLDPAMTFVDFARQLQMHMVEQRQYEYCPLDQIQRWIGVPHDAQIFEILVAFENFPSVPTRSHLRIEEPALHEASNYALIVYFTVRPQGFKTRFVFDPQRFSANDIELAVDLFLEFFQRLLKSPETRLGNLSLVAPEREPGLLALLAGAASPEAIRGAVPPQGDSFPVLFAQAVAAWPEHIAIEEMGGPGGRQETLTYQQLDRASNRLAHQLRELGVGPESLVAVGLERSAAALVALLAIPKAGGAALPVDPQYPAERIQHLLEDSGAKILITRSGLQDRFPGNAHTLLLDGPALEIAAGHNDQPFDSGLRPDNAAYVIYTSGSTGKSKGVVVEQKNLVAYTRDAIAAYGIGADDRVLQFATLSFDTSAEEIYPALATGATLVLRDDEMIASPGVFLKALDHQKISVLNLPTAYWHELCSELGPGSSLEIPASLRLTILGGEAALAERLERWQASVGERELLLLNTYGPTETTIVATRFDLSRWRPAEHDGEIPIGRCISGMRAYVLDDQLRLLPPGLPGELCLAGAGVARLYLNRPELTEDRFRPDPWGAPGERFYRTGDKVIARHDGVLLFRGRIDQQVKIRGFRVEPGEVESALLVLGSFHEVAVGALPDPSGGLRLVAWLVPLEGQIPPSTAEIRRRLSQKLPDYMVPSALSILPALPKTPSGKVDRRALPEPLPEKSVYGQLVPPRTPTEELVADIWQDVLGRSPIGVHEDFFQLGGHSLLAGRVTTRLRQALEVDVPLVTLFELPTIAELAQRLEELRGAGENDLSRLPPLVKRPAEPQGREASFGEQRMWFLQAFDPAATVYNLRAAFELRGPLDLAAWDRSLVEIVRRHEVLRAAYRQEEGVLRVHISPPPATATTLHDLSELTEENQEAAILELIHQDARQPFDLAQPPLYRFHLVRRSADFHLFLWSIHHAIFDGWSQALVMGELASLYPAMVQGEPSPLAEPALQYGDFAAWQRDFLQGEELEKQVAFWRRTLRDESLELPTEGPRPEIFTHRGDVTIWRWPAASTAVFHQWRRQEGLTAYIAMAGAWQAYLAALCGAERVALGSPIAGRRSREVEDLVGFFANTLVLCTELSPDLTFKDALVRAKKAALEAYNHQDLPFEKLVDALGVRRDASRNPLFQVGFQLLDRGFNAQQIHGLQLKVVPSLLLTSRFDLDLQLYDTGETIIGGLVFNPDLFSRSTIEGWLTGFATFLEAGLAEPGKRLADLPLLREADKTAQLDRETVVQVEMEQQPSVLELFHQRVQEAPQAPAISFAGEELTYGELNTQAQALANRLRQQGIRPEDRIGVLLERGLGLPVALLAVWKANAAYVPLDPAYPAERLRYMVEAASCRALISSQDLALNLPLLLPLPIIELGNPAPKNQTSPTDPSNPSDPSDPSDNNPTLPLPLSAQTPQTTTPKATPESLAYVLFTSGSTGKPKGVMVNHGNLSNFVRSMAQIPGCRRGDVLVSVTTVSFDIFGLELYLPLTTGAKVELVPREIAADGRLLAELIATSGATLLQATPATWRALLDSEWQGLPGLRALCGGEALPAELAQRLLPKIGELWNVYGPTETTIWSAIRPVGAGDEKGIVPLGEAIANTRLSIVDRQGRLLPPGTPGELWIGGAGVARGYIGRGDLTAERFVPDPYAGQPGARAYRTGDLVRRNAQDELEFLGRIDHQIKVRGFRIELGEIESVLARHPGVAEAVVVAKVSPSGGHQLVAYVVPRSEPRSADELRAHCAAALPDYMVPVHFAFLAALPLTPNNKVDRKALPDLALSEPSREFEAPQGEIEEKLAAIWCELLRVAKVGRQDNFFRLGGDSILVISAVTRSRSAGIDLVARDFFLHPNLQSLASASKLLNAAAPAVKHEIHLDLSDEDMASILDEIT